LLKMFAGEFAILGLLLAVFFGSPLRESSLN
jgi:hypothetical protein